MASLTETIAANNQAPTEGVDIAGNLSKGLQTGMQLATAKDQVEAKKLQLEEDRYKVDQMKFQAFDSMMKNLNRMNPVVAKQMSKNFKNRFQQYGFDPAIVDITLADPQFGRTYQNLSDIYAGKITGDKGALGDVVSSLADAGLLSEGLAAIKDAADNERSNKQLAQQNTQFYAGLKNAKDIAAMGIDKAQAVADKDVAKEFRKESRNLDDDLKKADDLMILVTKAKERFDEYSKDSVGGTGPLVTLGGTTSIANSKTQALKSTFSALSLDTLSKMFQGMSKLADTNAERARFESAQPSLTNDDAVNEQILNDMMDNAKRMRDKVLEAKRNLNESIGPAQSSSQRPQESQAVIDFKKYLETTKGSPEAKKKALDAFIKKNGG